MRGTAGNDRKREKHGDFFATRNAVQTTTVDPSLMMGICSRVTNDLWKYCNVHPIMHCCLVIHFLRSWSFCHRPQGCVTSRIPPLSRVPTVLFRSQFAQCCNYKLQGYVCWGSPSTHIGGKCFKWLWDETLPTRLVFALAFAPAIVYRSLCAHSHKVKNATVFKIGWDTTKHFICIANWLITQQVLLEAIMSPSFINGIT